MGLFSSYKKVFSGGTDFLMGKDYSGKQKKDITGITGPLGQMLNQSKASSKASLLKALGAIDQGYGKAGQTLAAQGALGTKSILDNETRAKSSNAQSMINRGLYGTTVTDAVDRGITSDTNQSLAELNTMLAQIGSNIDISKGQAQASAFGDLASVDQNFAQLMLSLGLGQLGATQNVQYGKQGGALPGLLNIGGQLAGKQFGAA